MGFSGVEVERMGQLEPLLNETLEKFYKEDMDLDRIKTSCEYWINFNISDHVQTFWLLLVMRKKERMYSNMESSSDFIQGPAIRNLIHGGDWEQYFSDDTAYDKFLNKDQDYWKDVVRESLKGNKILVS